MSGARLLATFDVEEWFHAENVRPSLPSTDWDALESRVEPNVNRLLDVLAETGSRSTFFVLGWIARTYPALLRRMVAEGHEVANHSDRHLRLDTMHPDRLARDLSESRDSIEQVTGRPVLGIRAPNFSISDAVLQHLADAGYWYDSSYYAFGAHDRYGTLTAPIDPERSVSRLPMGLLELPMSRIRFGRVVLPWSGGGYFRLIPYEVYRAGVARRLRRRSWFMFYMHPWEIDGRERPPVGMSRALRFRAYVGRPRMDRDLRRLLMRFGSSRIDETLLAMGYEPPSRAGSARPDGSRNATVAANGDGPSPGAGSGAGSGAGRPSRSE